MTARLDVWWAGLRVGALLDERATLSFVYDAGWMDDDRLPLSQSLPLSGQFGPAAVQAFFGGLLPEGAPRELLARRLGVSPGNDFALLERIGGDCAGAITLLAPGEQHETRRGSVTWLDDAGVEQLVAELPRRPMHADEGGEFRLSLAGAQDKLPVMVDLSGRIGLPGGGLPSTHVLKAPISRLPATVLNEAFCLALGRELGIHTVNARPRRVGDQALLLVERYDRRLVDDAPALRVHQEDFCQAMGLPAERKYQREGGPALVDCFALVDRAAAVPARARMQLLDGWTLSYLVGNHDAHAKNLSLLYGDAGAAVAPMYDVLSTVVYWKVEEMDRKMAMEVGGEYRPAYVRSRHLDTLTTLIGLNGRLVRRRLLASATSASAAALAVRARFEAELWWEPLLDKVVETVEQRAGWLAEICA
jgi:serine/threonine-protein kinase HipA